MNLQVILVQDIPNLGSLGDKVIVKGGYAHNHLIPKGLAIAANLQNTAQLQYRRVHLEKIRAQAIQDARQQIEAFSQLQLTIKAKAGPGGKLFGSITNREISTLLAQFNQNVDRRHIFLHDPIRRLGNHNVTIKLHSEVRVEMNIKVEAELPAQSPKETATKNPPKSPKDSSKTVVKSNPEKDSADIAL